jgi:hypothetical protein
MDAMRAAGFLGVEASIHRAFDVLACDDPIVRAALAGFEEDDNVDIESLKESIVSATVVAYKA